MHLSEIVKFLDETLGIPAFPDFPNALNGLQVGNSGSLSKIGAAVDASEKVIRHAAESRVDLLIVHHGIFWDGLRPWTGSTLSKMRLLIESDMAIYSAHLPLDAHPIYGNNRLLASALDLGDGVPFFDTFGRKIGLRFDAQISREVLCSRLSSAVAAEVRMVPGGPVVARNIGLVTGGCGSHVRKVAEEGIDTFITGEAPHSAVTSAEESGVNLLLGGHYATETFGVQAIAEALSQKFALPWQFFDYPTGF